MYSLFSTVSQTLDLYSPELFTRDIQTMIRGLAPGRAGGMRAVWSWCVSAEYRAARKHALQLRVAGKASGADLFVELGASEGQRIKWAELSSRSSSPQKLPNYPDARRNLELAATEIAELNSIVPKRQFESMPLDELEASIDALAKDRLTPMQLPKLCSVERGLEMYGAGKLVEEIRKTRILPEKWVPAFDQSWYASCLEAAQADDPEIAGFNGRSHDGYVKEFKALDKERIRIAAARVRRAYAERAIAAMNEHTSEAYMIRSEAEKKRRHRPLRALFADARDVLTALCPCWMASPLSVSQLLDTARSFDFVIFDEASQILPEDAMPAVMRGLHLVVAGDRWQLPPTTFFASADEGEMSDDESISATEGYESLLDTTNAFMPSWYLDWHYRSRDETLISFSNHYIYKDRLVTFPGPGGPPVLQHIQVDQPLGLDGQEESASTEVNRVVDLILEHAQARPHESLGVIAMGIRHSDRVQRALDQALINRQDLAPFFDVNADERFFVKNLERVQGDERDAIILTVGYGKDRGGNLLFRFGPLLSLGGQRRLNVAITRARQRMTLVSSFNHLNMDPAKIKPGTGVELLRNYFEYAGSGGKRLGDLASTDFPMNSFEAEVFDVLESKGIPLVSQVGASSYRIDLVAQHPKERGRYVLAIECDGASYHSSPTARDRDRLRQQQLENLGWKFHRIWSTDWFMRKDAEVARAVSAFENAVAAIDSSNPSKPVAPSKASSPDPNSSPAKSQGRRSRPHVSRRDAITDYSGWELISMFDWIESDGRLRTDEEMIDEILPELGLHRRGTRIEAALKSVLESRRNRTNPSS
jgi:very-short-patch-repair endonuclease